MITIDSIRERIVNAREFANENEEKEREAIFDRLLDALRDIERRPFWKEALEKTASEFFELRYGITNYLRQGVKRNPDLFLDILVQGAKERMKRIRHICSINMDCQMSKEEAKELESALLTEYGYMTPMGRTC